MDKRSVGVDLAPKWRLTIGTISFCTCGPTVSVEPTEVSWRPWPCPWWSKWRDRLREVRMPAAVSGRRKEQFDKAEVPW